MVELADEAAEPGVNQSDPDVIIAVSADHGRISDGERNVPIGTQDFAGTIMICTPSGLVMRLSPYDQMPPMICRNLTARIGQSSRWL